MVSGDEEEPPHSQVTRYKRSMMASALTCSTQLAEWGYSCHVIKDSRNCKSVVTHHIVERLNLPCEWHMTPLLAIMLQEREWFLWFIFIHKWWQTPWKSMVWWSANGHIERPWQHDHRMIHDDYKITFYFFAPLRTQTHTLTKRLFVLSTSLDGLTCDNLSLKKESLNKEEPILSIHTIIISYTTEQSRECFSKWLFTRNTDNSYWSRMWRRSIKYSPCDKHGSGARRTKEQAKGRSRGHGCTKRAKNHDRRHEKRW